MDFWAQGPLGTPWILQPRVLTRTLVDFWAHQGPWDIDGSLFPGAPGTPIDFWAHGPYGPDGFLGSGLFGTSVDFWAHDF